MPKRKSSDERSAVGAAVKRPAVAVPECKQKQHLYLLLDDWESGYSVQRLDVDTLDPDVAGADDPPPERFTEPPVARIESDHVSGSSLFVSHGTRILAMQPGESSPAIPALDMRTLGLSVFPWPSSARHYELPFFASVAGRLLVIPDDTHAVYLGDSKAARWSWTAMEARAPFYASQVTCYAVHPDGRTLFVSAASRARGRRSGTFSLDMERLEWTRHGDWLLPFSGQAYFDAEMEGWVGLYYGERGGAGRLCTCDVVTPVAGEAVTSSPSWKLGEDELFRKAPKLHLGAKLLYMGHSSRFCLVELLLHEGDEHLCSEAYNCPPRRRRVLCITTFGLRYNKDGHLRTTLQRARACKMYKIHHDSWGPWKPVAFWL